MKNLQLGFISLCLFFFSCGEEKSTSSADSKEEIKYQIDTESVSLKWTAYKTTAKAGVGGEFGKINVKDYTLAESKEGAIDNVSFTVPVSSLFTNNKDRDWKLINLFFGVMDNTEFISGTFHALEGDSDGGKGVMDLTMNGKTCDLPYDYTIKNDSMFIATTLNLIEWNGQEALDSIHEACFELHKGADGISKTWSEVDINASVGILKK